MGQQRMRVGTSERVLKAAVDLSGRRFIQSGKEEIHSKCFSLSSRNEETTVP